MSDDPCPMNICDGTGIIGNDDGTDGGYERPCPHTYDEGEGHNE